jgi:hypothetical protein
MKVITVFTCVLCWFVCNRAYPQISSSGIPWSYGDKSLSLGIPEVSIASPDIRRLLNEDFVTDTLNLPHRFMEIIPVDIDFITSASRELLRDGSLVYRLKLSSAGALAISLYFDRFYLPSGSSLYLYDENGGQLKGSFTEKNNNESLLFATELLLGDVVVLELNESAWSPGSARLRISGFGYAYREIPQINNTRGFGGSDSCEINVRCSPEGNNWQTCKAGIVRIQVKVSGSAFWCSGSLVNNARNDKKPYVLTADHCAYQMGHYASAADLMQWLFYFGYESPSCENPVTEPQLYSMVGASKVANGGERGNTGSDFYFLLLNQNIPGYYQQYFNGWSAINEVSQNGVVIHHPEGDIKKISTYLTPVQSTNWFNNTVQSHWKVFWIETENGWGVTEGGSSGSPLFNNDGRIIGTLTGGYSACDSSGVVGPNKPDYFGKFSYHWESNGTADTCQLKPWLDPDNTGITFMDGLNVGFEDYENGKEEKLLVYPNPAVDFINLYFTKFEPSKADVEIVDVIGTSHVKYTFGNQALKEKLNIGDLPKGIYLLVIQYGDARIIKRFIKN